jgi:hypothetical protein
MCHTWQTNAPLKLEPLQEGPDGETYWSEEQSRRNFVEVARLVTPGSSEESRLLNAPLALRAGGRGGHAGDSLWASKEDPEWQLLADWVRGAAPIAGVGPVAEPASAVDFEFFQSCVQRVLLTGRPGMLPCTECHESGTAGPAHRMVLRRSTTPSPTRSFGSDVRSRPPSAHSRLKATSHKRKE